MQCEKKKIFVNGSTPQPGVKDPKNARMTCKARPVTGSQKAGNTFDLNTSSASRTHTAQRQDVRTAKSPISEPNQQQHLEKNDFYAWKVTLSPVASRQL
ncbi:hypothetical protein [Limnohabitans sp. 2KL-1]|jgi:hypothetical protein|uniref:hypothetical protein n=1 Tax=Limnohabitans sp. 2KL-1 TaxID=1100699 RepID=UPI0011B1E4F8|nr:hypothetical protein [Limnohabitans sp. 2KL-1]